MKKGYIGIPHYNEDKGTYDIKLMSVDNPKREILRPQDIADSLSNIRRFSAHLPYSVLEHSINLSILMKSERFEKQALLHEVSEAAGLGDISSPLKKAIFTQDTLNNITAFERRLLRLYGITHIPFEVHKADKAAAEAEMEFFFGTHFDDSVDQTYYKRSLELLNDTYYNRSSMKELKAYFIDRVNKLCP